MSIEHPEQLIYQTFLENLDILKHSMTSSKADKSDIYFNFFIQFIAASSTDVPDALKNMVKTAVYEDFSHMDPRQMAAHIIRKHCTDWPEQFVSGPDPRVYLSDIRNQVIFVIWSQHRHMIDSQWMPYSKPEGTPEQNTDYKRVAHAIGGRMIDPKDSERLCTFFSWVHYLKMIHHVKLYMDHETTLLPVQTLNTCSGSWLHTYNTEGLASLIWELFLDVWHYDTL